MSEKYFYSNSEKETEEIAYKLAKKIPFGSIVGLKGNLGAGKTVFARGFARGLNIDEIVSSPTFTLVKEYLAEDNQWLYHLDLYRINDSDAALVFGIDEYLNDSNAIVLIEWPERIHDLFDENAIFIDIERVTDSKRIIRVESNTPGSQQDMDLLQKYLS